MVSKPKPGLGKGLVRTIQHGQHGQHAYILPTTGVKEKERIHSKPLRQYATLSARPLDILLSPGRPFEFARRDGPTFQDFFAPLPPSPAPHPITANARSVHAAHASAGGVLQEAPLLASNITLELPDQTQLETSVTYASRYIFKFGSFGLAKDRPNIPPRPSNRATPPPRPRSFPIQDIQPPAIYNSTSIGEDAYYARADGMCVADGVGGWARSGKGADAGKWSRLLTHFCEAEVRRWWDGKEEYVEDVMEQGWAAFTANMRFKVKLKTEDAAGLPQGLRRRKLDPVEIMQKGFEKCLSCFLKEGIHGSSTCLLALLHHSHLLVANVGDCSLLVLRGGEIIFRTDEMQHAFNFPLQLGTHSRDEPMKDAKQYKVGVEKGDVVIVGSDGLMDNLFEDEIVDCLSSFAIPSDPAPSLPAFDPQKVSEALCRAAREKSEDIASETPFMLRAAAEGIDFVGGKKDDISVIVGVVGASDGSDVRLKTT